MSDIIETEAGSFIFQRTIRTLKGAGELRYVSIPAQLREKLDCEKVLVKLTPVK